MPALHVVGYYDFFSRESVDNFTIMQKQARDPETRKKQRLVLGPWDHGTIGKSKVAEVDFGPAAALDVGAIQLDWFDRHLKQDAASNSKPFPPVKYFSMGDNVWRNSNTWPPEGTQATSFYLQSDGKANTRKGSGRLTRESPKKEQPADTFRADPSKEWHFRAVIPVDSRGCVNSQVVCRGHQFGASSRSRSSQSWVGFGTAFYFPRLTSARALTNTMPTDRPQQRLRRLHPRLTVPDLERDTERLQRLLGTRETDPTR